jgi:hypothetical protein
MNTENGNKSKTIKMSEVFISVNVRSTHSPNTLPYVNVSRSLESDDPWHPGSEKVAIERAFTALAWQRHHQVISAVFSLTCLNSSTISTLVTGYLLLNRLGTNL